jgi:hypothetical protein
MLWVPTVQVEHFLSIINAEIGAALVIPGGANEEKFKVTFRFGGQARPRFLGRSAGAATSKALIAKIPPYNDDDDCQSTQYGVEDLIKKLNAANFGSGQGGQKDKEKKAAEKLKQRTDFQARIMKETRLHLGLHKLVEGWGFRDTQVALFDPEGPPPGKPKESVVFICIDVESMEGCSSVITEVGVSILDANDTIGVAPGENGKNWFPFMKTRHLWVNEYRYFRNSKWVHGCPELFDFG